MIAVAAFWMESVVPFISWKFEVECDIVERFPFAVKLDNCIPAGDSIVLPAPEIFIMPEANDTPDDGPHAEDEEDEAAADRDVDSDATVPEPPSVFCGGGATAPLKLFRAIMAFAALPAFFCRFVL